MDTSGGDKIPEYQRAIVDTLESFMQQCLHYIEQQKLPPMTEEERLAKMDELVKKIQEKEKELADLEAERDRLDGVSNSSSQCKKTCPDECNELYKIAFRLS